MFMYASIIICTGPEGFGIKKHDCPSFSILCVNFYVKILSQKELLDKTALTNDVFLDF